MSDPVGRRDLAVVVVSFNSHQLLREHLATSSVEQAPARVIVVDNSDDAEEIAATAQLCAHHSWDLVRAGGNVGFGAGVNLGVGRAVELGCTKFLVLNPDAWVDVDTLRRLADLCGTRPLEAVSPVVRTPDGTEWFARGSISMRRGRLRTRTPGTPGDVPWISGAAVMLSRELWQRVGGFDERFFLYWEDVDLSWRIQRAGGHVRVASDLSAHHLVGATQSGSHKSPGFVYYNCRNRLLFAGLHLGLAQRVGWLLGTPRLTWELIGLGGRTPAAWWAALRGVASGIPQVLRRPERLRGAGAAVPVPPTPPGRAGPGSPPR